MIFVDIGEEKIGLRELNEINSGHFSYYYTSTH